ncbi:MAG TPA: zf-HC2 domain-containing protein [Puia sp.]|nr:zf-HC2 domain-containing protein [Puia sp.]
MNCKEVQTLLIDWLDQKLEDSSAARVKEHLDGCEACRHEAEELRMLFAAMKATIAETPPRTLRESFDTMLQSELNMLTTANIIQEFRPDRQAPGKTIRLSLSSPVWKVAAAVILLAGGIAIGKTTQPPSKPSMPDYAQIDSLRKEVKEMKQAVMLNLIDDESASQRIKAVSYAEEMTNPDQQVIDVLIGALNHDKNVNVRLAALYSLTRFADRRSVRDSLVSSLRTQTEPIIQVVLINLLAEKRDQRAIAPIRDIMTNKKTLKEVKDVAQRSLKVI